MGAARAAAVLASGPRGLQGQALQARRGRGREGERGALPAAQPGRAGPDRRPGRHAASQGQWGQGQGCQGQGVKVRVREGEGSASSSTARARWA